MTITVCPGLEGRWSVCADRGFALEVVYDGDSCVVYVSGELDLATRSGLFRTCTAGNRPSMVVDISRLRFIDCCGYGGIVASRNVVEADGRTLTVRGATGEPVQLLSLIAHLERQSPPTIAPTRRVVHGAGVIAVAVPTVEAV